MTISSFVFHLLTLHVNEIIDVGGIGFPPDEFFGYCYYDEKQPLQNYMLLVITHFITWNQPKYKQTPCGWTWQ